jgi:hypothetical protein
MLVEHVPGLEDPSDGQSRCLKSSQLAQVSTVLKNGEHPTRNARGNCIEPKSISYLEP